MKDYIFFALSEDSVVWHKFQKPEGGWSTWRPLADRRKMSSGPQSVRYANGTIQVFARGTDRQYYYSQMTSLNEWSNWQSLGDLTFFSQPVPVITAAGSCLVFGVSTETHSVWYTESTPLSPSDFTFSQWANLGGDATGAPAVYLDAEALVHLFIRGSNRALWHLAETYPRSAFVSSDTTKRWGDWECLGGVMASSPRTPITLNGGNLVEIYGRAADKALWFRRQTTQQDSSSVDWDSWISLGGVLASGPAVALTDDGMVSVFARATDKAVYFKSQFEDENGDIHFTQWNSLGGMFSATPNVVVRSDGTIDIFARGIDKAIWHSHQIETNGTRTFTSWHSLGGHTRKFPC